MYVYLLTSFICKVDFLNDLSSTSNNETEKDTNTKSSANYHSLVTETGILEIQVRNNRKKENFA